MRNENYDIAIIGGGPSALLILKNLLDSKTAPLSIIIFEKQNRLGIGMPYGKLGSCREHIANVSANELPNFKISFIDYLSQFPTTDFPEFSENGKCNPYQVIPRLLLGNYLEFLFDVYIKMAKTMKIKITVKCNSSVDDVIYEENPNFYNILVNKTNIYAANLVIIATGHYWPNKNEVANSGWYDSPYPPSKFTSQSNFPIAIRGTSLTAVDAVKTQARLNGDFSEMLDGQLSYTLKKGSENFSISMFSTGGFLPALRFHTEDELYSNNWTMTLEEIYDYKNTHNGFVDLDYVFNINFKMPLRDKDPAFYDKIKDLTIEKFVEEMMRLRKELDSFQLFKAEYVEAEKSIKRQQSISWKEALSAFSYAMNYPAKHFSAEDMLRLRKTLLPLISIIIASLPQSSYKEIIALYDAGIINLIQVDKNSYVEPASDKGCNYHYQSFDNKDVTSYFQLYINAVGQQALDLLDLPFSSLKSSKKVSQAYLNFLDKDVAATFYKNDKATIFKRTDGNFYMNVHGLEINDHFQSLDVYGQAVENLYIMAVPFIGGLNPDYSGLDFCDTAAKIIIKSILT